MTSTILKLVDWLKDTGLDDIIIPFFWSNGAVYTAEQYGGMLTQTSAAIFIGATLSSIDKPLWKLGAFFTSRSLMLPRQINSNISFRTESHLGAIICIRMIASGCGYLAFWWKLGASTTL
jgi:hypothetical protein